jgi:two-component system invasion response regulator UvrY
MAVIKPASQLQQQSVSILLVESRQLLRAGLQRVLEDASKVRVLAGVANFDEAIRETRKQQPDIIIASVHSSVTGLLDGARKLCRQFPKVSLLIIAQEEELVIPDRLLQSGIAGCIDSRCSIEELLMAVDSLSHGGRYISDNMAQQLATFRVPGENSVPFAELTHRELQILLLVAEGRNTQGIARELCLTQKTINTYKNRMLDKLGVDTDVALVHLAIRHGLVHL